MFCKLRSNLTMAGNWSNQDCKWILKQYWNIQQLEHLMNQSCACYYMYMQYWFVCIRHVINIIYIFFFITVYLLLHLPVCVCVYGRNDSIEKKLTVIKCHWLCQHKAKLNLHILYCKIQYVYIYIYIERERGEGEREYCPNIFNHFQLL